MVSVSRLSLVRGCGFGAFRCSTALCSLAVRMLATLASAASFLWRLFSALAWRSCFFCITSGMVLQTAKWLEARSCASCAVVILLSLGLLQSHKPAVLLWQFCCTFILVRERSGQVCLDTILERKEPGSMPLSGVAPLYDGVVPRLNVGRLARVVLARVIIKRLNNVRSAKNIPAR